MKETLMIFELMENPSQIHLLTHTFSTIPLTQDKETASPAHVPSHAPRLGHQPTVAKSSSSVNDNQTLQQGGFSLPLSTQRYIAKQLMIILQASLNINFHVQRQSAIDLAPTTLKNQFKKVLSSQYPEEVSAEQRAIMEDEALPLLDSLLASHHSLPTVLDPPTHDEANATFIQSDSWDFQMAILELALWGMSEAFYAFTISIAFECLALIPEESLTSVFPVWVVAWSEYHRLHHQRSKDFPSPGGSSLEPRASEESYHVIRRTSSLVAACLDRISLHWGNRHPLTAHTHVACAWCAYVNHDLLRAQSLLTDSIQHSISIMFTSISKQHQDPTRLASNYLPSFPRSILDPVLSHTHTTSTLCQSRVHNALMDFVPPPRAPAYLGHLFRLLGGVCLSKVAEHYSQVGTALITGEENQNVLIYSLKETDMLCAQGVRACRTAVQILESHSTAGVPMLLILSSKFDLCASLFLKASVSNAIPGDNDAATSSDESYRECLALSKEVYTAASKTLPLQHRLRILASVQLARLLERQEHHEEGLRLLEEALSGSVPLDVSLTREAAERDFNLFSFLLFALPSIHFSGIHEALPSLTTVRLSSLQDVDNPPFGISHIKQQILRVFFTSSLDQQLFPAVVKLFQALQRISIELTQLEAMEKSSAPSLSSSFSPFASHQDAVVEVSSSTIEFELIVHTIQSWPHLLSRDQLLDPRVNTCIPLPSDRVPMQRTDIASLLIQLVEWSNEDLATFRKIKKHPVQKSCQKDTSTTPSTITATKKIPTRYSLLEHRFDSDVLLEMYSFKSEALNILCSVLFEFLDVSKFNHFMTRECLSGRS